MASDQVRFHVHFDGRRTTISVDRVLYELMAVKFGTKPDTSDAYANVREWIEDKIVSNPGSGEARKNTSQWVRLHLIKAIAKRRLLRRRDTWKSGKDWN